MLAVQISIDPLGTSAPGRCAVKAYIGIDPGLAGAVARIDCMGIADVFDIPTVVVKGTRRDYLAHQFATLVRTLSPNAVAVIEQPFAMPRQASNTTLLQGRGYGLAEGILVGCGVAYEAVAPAKWKKAMSIPPGSEKGASRVMASRLFPYLAPQLARVRDDGRAEALLLAVYARRVFGGEG